MKRFGGLTEISSLLELLLIIGLFLTVLTGISYAANQAPLTGTVTQSSSVSDLSGNIAFSATYYDSDGYSNIKYAYMLINKSLSGQYAVYVVYKPSENKLYLRDNESTGWLGGFAPGSANIIENTFGILNCATSSVSGSGGTLTLNCDIRFKNSFSGLKNIYLYVSDKSGSYNGWNQVGTIDIANQLPVLGNITPSDSASGIGDTILFTSSVSDPDGWENIKNAQVLINSTQTSVSGCYLHYSAYQNKLYLRDDTNSKWLGGYTPGSANTIENSYVVLDCSNTVVSLSGNAIAITWAVKSKKAFSGVKKIYLLAADNNECYAGWLEKGTWTITNRAPSTGSVTPTSISVNPGDGALFTASYSDPDGYENIRYVQLIANNYIGSSFSCYCYYNRFTNKIYLRNDDATSWLGGYEPGSANIIENSYASINCANVIVSGLGDTLTVAWDLAFKRTYTGTKNIYLHVTDSASEYAGWNDSGVRVIIKNQVPSVGAVSPSAGYADRDTSVILTATYSDPDGYGNIQYVRLLLNNTLAYTNCAYLQYNQLNNKLYLRDETNSSWLGGYEVGSANTIENLYVKINCEGTNVVKDGNNLTVNWNVTFKSAFRGAKNIYLQIKDSAGVFDGFKPVGSWEITEPITLGDRSTNHFPHALFSVVSTDKEVINHIEPSARYTVSLNADASYDEDGDSLTYLWDFGDGCTYVGTNPMHVYQNAGEYTITLKVTDSYGNEDTKSDSINMVRSDGDVYTTWYFAEGCTAWNFSEWILIENPNAADADVTVTFMNEDGQKIEYNFLVIAKSRYTINVNELNPNAAHSTKVQCNNGLGIVVERAMYWGSAANLPSSVEGNGKWTAGHCGMGAPATSNVVYLAEGCTRGFNEYILVQNPNDSEADCTLVLMKTDGSTIERDFTIGAESRHTIKVNDIVPDEDLSAKIVCNNGFGIVAERSMYWGSSGEWTGGHCNMGVASPLSAWYFAEGCTAFGFDEWILVQNPNVSEVLVRATFMKQNGETIDYDFSVPATGRKSINVNAIVPNESVSAVIKSLNDNKIVAERSMYWSCEATLPSTVEGQAVPSTAEGCTVSIPWKEGHCDSTTLQPNPVWYLAEGATLGTFSEWILIQNPNNSEAIVRITLMKSNGETIEREINVPKTSRFTLNVNEIANGVSLSAKVECTNGLGIMVERAMYFDSDSVKWSGGTCGYGAY